MVVRQTPAISPEPEQERGVLYVAPKEIREFLRDNKLPRTKINVRRARRRLKREKKRALPRGKDVSYAQSDAPWQIVYGRFKTGGIISFLYIVPNTKWLHLVITMACHEISSVDFLYLDDKLVTFGGSQEFADSRWSSGDWAPVRAASGLTSSKVFMTTQSKGAPNQPANADLIGQLPEYWTPNHRQNNRAHIYCILVYHKVLFAEGMPDIAVRMDGKKVYDPRTQQTAFSQNSALILADYLMDTNYGMGVSQSEVDLSTSVGGLAWAANICDQNVPLASGGTEKRYQTNGLIDTSLEPQAILEELALAMAGNVVYTNGKWRFYPATYVTPSITLTEDDLLGAPTINRLVSKGDIFNVVRGEYVSAENDYEVTDYPPSRNNTYVAEDGDVERFFDMPIAMVTSGTQCQRIAKIELERHRRQTTLEADWGLKAMQLNVGDTCYVDLERYGYTNKVFEVADFDFNFDSNLRPTIKLVLEEIDSGVFDWDETQDENAVTAAPSTSLPDPSSITDPSGLTLESGTSHLYIRSDGTIFSRLYLRWTLPDDLFVTEDGRYHIQYKKTSAATWSAATDVQGDIDNFYILDVEDGVSYDVRIRSQNGLGVVGNWISASHTIIGKTAPPSNVPAFSANFQEYAIRLTWTKVPDLDIDRYELRRGGSGWSDATFIGEVKGNNFVDNYQVAGTHDYRIKAIDTSGNYSLDAASTSATITPPSPVTELTVATIDNNVLLDWEEGAQGAFPVITYKIYRGETFATATLLGQVDGTFHAFLETIGGIYTYWVSPVDTAGNQGVALSIIGSVFDPPDYILYDDLNPNVVDGVLTDCVSYDGEDNAILAPVDNSDTWDSHFSDNSWSNINDQIDAGYPLFCQPTPASGVWSLEVDYGAILPSSGVKLSWEKENIAGNVDVTAQLEVKEAIADNWTVYNQAEAFVVPFRYARYTLTFDGDDDTSVAVVRNVNIKIDVKKAKDGGNARSSATGWTTVVFNRDFIDIINIDAHAANSSGDELYTIIQYDWETPDTDQFDIKVIDSNGTQITEDFSWSAEGIVRPPT